MIRHLTTFLLLISVSTAFAVDLKYQQGKEGASATHDDGKYTLTLAETDAIIGRTQPTGVRIKLESGKRFKQDTRENNKKMSRVKSTAGTADWQVQELNSAEDGEHYTVTLNPGQSRKALGAEAILEFDAERFPGQKSDRRNGIKSGVHAEVILFDPLTAMPLQRTAIEL